MNLLNNKLSLIVFVVTVILGVATLFSVYKLSNSRQQAISEAKIPEAYETRICDENGENCICKPDGDAPDPATCHPCDDDNSCFLPGTKVITDKGEKNIEEVAVGDQVQNFDEATQELTYSTVSEPYSVVRDHYYIVKTTSGKEVKVTDEHPFYVGFEEQPEKTLAEKVKAQAIKQYIALKDKLHGVDPNRTFPDQLQPGFKRVKDLEIGDIVYVKDGNQLVQDKITSIKKVFGTQKVYNLKLADSPNTFFADGFAVHNKKIKTWVGQVYCQDEGGEKYPMPGVEVRLQASLRDYGFKTHTFTTDANGRWALKNYNTHDTPKGHSLFVWIHNIPKNRTLPNGTRYQNMVRPEPLSSFLVNCSNSDICPQHRSGLPTCNPNRGGGSYLCDLRTSAKAGWDFRFTNCGTMASPTPSPSPSPSPTPVANFQCVDIVPQAPAVERGETLNFTCTGDATNTTLTSADFRVLLDGTELDQFTANGVAMTNNQATYDLTVPEEATAGSYLVQCRVCESSGSCSEWGQSNLIDL